MCGWRWGMWHTQPWHPQPCLIAPISTLVFPFVSLPGAQLAAMLCSPPSLLQHIRNPRSPPSLCWPGSIWTLHIVTPKISWWLCLSPAGLLLSPLTWLTPWSSCPDVLAAALHSTGCCAGNGSHWRLSERLEGTFLEDGNFGSSEAKFFCSCHTQYLFYFALKTLAEK